MKLMALGLFMCISSLCHSQGKAKFIHNIDSLIYQYIVSHDLPSVSVGVVYQDSVLYGRRIVNSNDAVLFNESKEQSIFNIASVAKPLVATAVMMLAQQGLIDIQLPVVNYLPHFNIDSKFKDEITVEHLLTHTSGLPSVSSSDDYEYLQTDISDAALSNHIKSLSSVKLKSRPGKKYGYSNVGFEVLGEIIAKVSKVSFDEYMDSSLFQPLGMKNTSYLLSDFAKKEIAQPHHSHPYILTDRFPYNREFSPSGGLFTSIGDMNKWMIFNLNDGEYNNFKPLSENYFSLLTTPRIDTKEDGYIGLSWFTKPTNAGKIIFHDGLDLGYSALMILYSDPKIGILVLSNHQEADCNEILNMISRSISFEE